MSSYITQQIICVTYVNKSMNVIINYKYDYKNLSQFN